MWQLKRYDEPYTGLGVVVESSPQLGWLERAVLEDFQRTYPVAEFTWEGNDDI